MRWKYTLFRLWLLGLCFQFAVQQTNKLKDGFWIKSNDTGNFTQKRCTQRVNHTIHCEDVEEEILESQWPAGTYAIPMSRYGCPESYLQGWREGHLSLTWRSPRAVYVESRNLIFDSHDIIDLTKLQINGIRSMVFGQATKDYFKIYFCYKFRQEPSLDVGIWPDGNYSIYRTNNSCPDGFDSNLWRTSLPEVSRWTKHGFTPDLEILSGNSTILEIKVCTKTTAVSAMDDMFLSEHNSSRQSVWNGDLLNFFLIKHHDEGSCPVPSFTIVIEETVYIEQDLDDVPSRNSTNLTALQTLCFYQSFKGIYYTLDYEEESILRAKRIINAYSVHIANITKGFAKNDEKLRDFTATFIQDIFSTRTSPDVIEWIIVDLGRSVLVSAIGLDIHEEFQHSYKVRSIECTIGEDKWALLYSDTLSCLYSPLYDPSNRTYELLFLREMEGRFLSLYVRQRRLKVHEYITSIDVFTEHVTYESSSRCNIDLGMIAGEIRDEEIWASSWLDEFPPEHSRPYSSGWCANVSDEEPYIQIVFPAVIAIEGITIYNWESLFLFNRTMLMRKVVAFGAHEFQISASVRYPTGLFKFSENFYIDTSRPITAPQTFWFTRKIETDYIRIYILKSLSEGLKCLRFELHGCKTTSIYKLVNRMIKLRQSDNEVVTFANEIFEEFTRISSLGYPLRHGGQTYIWIVNLQKYRFIKLRFQDISLGYCQDELSPCNDTITISRDLHANGHGRVIDYSFVIEEDYTLSVETGVTSLVMSLKTCTLTCQLHDARGFTALIKSEHVPTCFSLQENIPWHLGLKETCHQRAMILTSMSYLGFPFRETTEEWTIHIPSHQIHLQIFQFDVRCLSDYSASRFKVVDLDKENIYCNFNRPPDVINSTYDILTISFYRAESELVFPVDGFRLVYTSSREKMEYLTTAYVPNYSEVKNVAFGKPAIMSSADINFRPGIDTQAGKATDGLTHQELRGGSCFLTTYEYEPWWMVDLLDVFRLEYVVLYNRLDCCEIMKSMLKYSGLPQDTENNNIQISTGMNSNMLQSSGYICGYLRKIETIDQSGITARFLRLTALKLWTRLSLCEVQIYGQLDQEHNAQTVEQFTLPRKVHGNWGNWASWENICNCNGYRTRHRECNNPQPDFGGTPCAGRDYSLQPCRIDFNCTMRNVALNKSTFSSSEKVEFGDVTYHNYMAVGGLYIEECFESDWEFQPWWMVDLEGVFHLQRAVIYIDSLEETKLFQVIEDSNTLYNYQRNLELSTGMTKCDIKSRDFECERQYEKRIVASLLGITGRFVKLQIVGVTTQLYLCEVEIYGQEAGDGAYENNTECSQHNQVAGGFSFWSNWSSCSNECGSGIKSRTRTCSNPSPKNSGRDCFGERKEIQVCFGNESCPVCSKAVGKCYSIFQSSTVWINARYNCWERQMQLVSIFSLEELRFIKTLLRERRYYDAHLTNNLFNVSFYVHIGLRFLNKEYVPVWENKVLAHFLAWKPGEPSTKACTRMHFQSYTEDNTWESEDCEFDLAEYFVCEYQLEGKYIAQSISNVMYSRKLKTVDITYSGKACQRWDVQYPHRHDLSGPYVFQVVEIPIFHDNYCRDIWDNGYLWCLTKDPSTRWEVCHVRNDITVHRECNIDIYNTGRINVTVTGKTCLSWKGTYDENLWTLEPYCRDPYGDGYAWCYVNESSGSGKVNREICDIKGEIESSRKKQDTLKALDFNCDNGVDIPNYFRCNGIFDCKDKTDETGCHSNYKAHQLFPHFNDSGQAKSYSYTGMFFICSTNEWINIVAVCDSVIDCFDASDEIECNVLSDETNSVSVHSTCRVDQFQCDDGDCIHVSQACDLIPDCIDASDEYCEHDVCSSSEYKCDNGECISSEQRCDAIRQCLDGSDENNCDRCQTDVAFHCDILRCIPKRLQCNNYAECEDGSDELFCGNEGYITCKEWWNAGYRHNGNYIIEGIQVKCNFDEYHASGIAYTIIDNLDKYDGVIVSGNYEMRDDVVYLSETYICKQQINRPCQYSLREEHGDQIDQCVCTTYIFDPAAGTFDHAIRRDRPIRISNQSCADVMVGNRSISHYSPSRRTLNFGISLNGDNRHINYIGGPSSFVVQIGPAVCNDFNTGNYTHSVDIDDISCAVNGQTYPVAQKCILNIDNAGFPKGCRDGSHLTNCEKFTCPNNTVKCPGSYCLPVQFVCDGEIHCERGQDEENCGCETLQSETLILYEKGITDELLISQFSRQFYTPTSIVRLLSIETSKPLKSFGIERTQILVTDRQIDQRGDTTWLPECSFKVMSKDFFKSIKFTKNGTKGLIYIQNSLTSKEVADEIFSNFDYLNEDYKIYRVTQDLNTDFNSETVVPKVIPVRVRRWKTLTAIGAEFFSAICRVNSKVYCRDQYKCASSKTCIPLELVCDGYRHCVHGDDELLCDFTCPYWCFCSGFYVSCRATNSTMSAIDYIPKTARKLDLSLNKMLNSVLQQPALDFILSSFLNLSGCDISALSSNAFNRLRNLQLLDISYNLITTLQDRVFIRLTKLKTLHLHGNFYLSRIDPYAFHNLLLIRDLNLANSLLTKISANTFAGLKLKNIDLSNNRLEDIEAFSFSNLSVNIINFERNTIKQLNKEIFTGVADLKLLRTPSFKFCCIRPNYVDEHNCFPTKDEFSSCEDLMRHSALQFLLWLIGVLTLIGNCLSLIYRLKVDQKRLKLGYGIFVTNLAVADFLMGLYLLIIAIADAAFRKRYIFVDDYWRGSFLCNLAGVLSTISSEASVLFLCLITLDRLLVIKFPFGSTVFTTKRSVICVILAWLFSSFIAILPVAYEGYFQNKFYSRSGVCIALPLTRDRPPGWVYSISVFVGLNFITFLLVAIGQWSIFYEMQKSSGMATTAQSSRKRDLKVARNLLLVVATDFMCWFPIGVMGLLALSGHALSGDVYAWAAVFILPVNSALNPILYTLTAIIGGKDFRPSTKEHSRAKKIKELGEGFLQFHTVSRRLALKGELLSSKYWSVHKIFVREIDIPLFVILRSAAQLAACFDVLHCSCCLGLHSFDEKSVHLRVRNRQVLGEVKITGELSVSVRQEDKTDDMYRYGILLRNIISAWMKLNRQTKNV